MKTLKFDHKLANLIRAGSKTSTWRLYDDKDLKVNDEVELIDKVNPGDPTTWESLGTARVDVVTEKRLGEITKKDFFGHESFGSREEMLAAYQSYYGSQVSSETPVKMIRFTIDTRPVVVGARSTLKLREAKMYSDGGSRGNPGPSASGFVIMGMDGKVVVKKGVYLGITTNNQAEYQSLKLGLEEAKAMGVHNLHVYMDSMLVINQMLGKFKVKNRDLWPIYEAVRELVETFDSISFTHVPRELNKIADAAVNEALDETIA